MVVPLSLNFSVFTVKLHVGHEVGVRKFRNFTIICSTTSLLTEFYERSNYYIAYLHHTIMYIMALNYKMREKIFYVDQIGDIFGGT